MLLLDATTDGVGKALEVFAASKPAYFQWQFEATGYAGVALVLGVSLALEDSTSDTLLELPISSGKHIVAGSTSFYDTTSMAFTNASGSANVKGIFYLDNVPRIVVPKLQSSFGTWRVRLWGWS